MSQNLFLLLINILIVTHLPGSPAPPVLPEPDPETIKTQSYLPAPSPPTTIPAFPEQSNVAGCSLDLSEELFQGIKSACGPGSSKHHHHQPDPNSYPGQLHKTRCCPVLAAWLYSAYSKTALDGTINKAPTQTGTPTTTTATTSFDMPLLPDDSESCVDSLEKALSNKGIELLKPNETCDVVYCYCGIRLHPFSCPQAFHVNQNGFLVGGQSVKSLEKDCLSNSVNGYAGLGGCSKCLNSLYLLGEDQALNVSKSEDRARKMRSRDCELMGLTWLLNKNRSAYIHTVSAVLRAFMMSTDGSDPQSCTLNSDGMPLAVDSSEINDQSSATMLQMSLYLLALSLLCTRFLVSLTRY